MNLWTSILSADNMNDILWGKCVYVAANGEDCSKRPWGNKDGISLLWVGTAYVALDRPRRKLSWCGVVCKRVKGDVKMALTISLPSAGATTVLDAWLRIAGIYDDQIYLTMKSAGWSFHFYIVSYAGQKYILTVPSVSRMYSSQLLHFIYLYKLS